MTLKSINPENDALIREYPEMDDHEIERALGRASTSHLQWASTPLPERSAILRRMAAVLRDEGQRFAELMALEMGKPVKDGVAESEKCAWVCDYYADHAEGFLSPIPVDTGSGKSHVHFAPLGILLAVMPWNYPFWQLFRCAAPALMAGNAVVLKHASNVTGCALAIGKIAAASGAPDGLLTVLRVPGHRMAGVIGHRGVRAVTLTGSTPAGRKVATAAGEGLKKSVLELGGSDPYIVLEDADLPHAAETCVKSRLLNSGQSCIAAKRFIVVDAVRREFEERVVERMKARTVGSPLDNSVDIGPQARGDLRNDLHDQVLRSLEKGARCLLGGRLPDGPGCFYPLTVISNVRPGMAAFDEETFGPVAAIVPARDEAEAVRLANATSFGLGAAVFTRNLERGERIAVRELEAGNAVVNTFVKSDPRLPFGGINDSGYGRELSSFGIREFVNIKSVVVDAPS
jgi:succinate-semialdehyde dehydrogenase/glutarate-semialdehyde dehydrogenase